MTFASNDRSLKHKGNKCEAMHGHEKGMKGLCLGMSMYRSGPSRMMCQALRIPCIATIMVVT